LKKWWHTYWVERVEPRIFLLEQLRSATGALAAGTAALNLLAGALFGGFLIASSVVIGRVPAAVNGGLGSAQWRSLVVAFIGSCVILFGQQILTPLSASLGQLVKHRVDGQFHDRLLDVSLSTTGIAPHEDDASLANLRLAAEGLEKSWRTPGDAAAGTLALVARYSRLGAAVLVLGVAVSWWAAAAICAVVILFRIGHRDVVRTYTRLWPVMNPLRRESEYFRGLGVGQPAAKELRIFGLTRWVVDRYEASAIAAIRPLWRERRRVNVTAFLWRTVVALVVVGFVVAAILRAAAEGQLTLTELTLGIQATLGAVFLGEFYHESDTGTQFGMMAARALDRFRDQVTAAAADEPATAGTAPAPSSWSEIHFDEVTFSYPGSDRVVLNGLTLRLRAGECTALVGLNGSGKTTLVKLLARLYEPTGGAIRVDDRDIRSLPIDAWRRQIAVVFQDFNRYELSVADNIAFGAIEHQHDDERIAATAAKAGVSGFAADLPHGLRTLLAAHLEDGVDLSGGQWQRVAIARALFAVDAGARVLVLDEPTAALDVRAEAAFFDEFAALTRGSTTLLISHRFSSVRHADRIVVLSEGRVIEDGTHESLLADGGRYAELFQLQARRFDAGLDVDGDDDAMVAGTSRLEANR
jgi:ATP-binding cassette subfamily B protein